MNKVSKRILAVIPARAGSKGIPHKNYKNFDGKPLICYAIENALASRYVTDVVVTTDDAVVKDIVRKFEGVSVVDRPSELAGDKVTLDGVVYHAVKEFEQAHGPVDYCVTMQATSPLLRVETMDDAISSFLSDEENDALISVVEDVHLAWGWNEKGPYPKYEKRLNRQELPKEYREAGAFVVAKVDAIISTTRWKNGRISVWPIPTNEAVDIDTHEDWVSAESLSRDRRIKRLAAEQDAGGSGWQRKIESGGVYLIAEVGVNYYDIAVQRGMTPLDAAKLMIREAKEAGVDAVKFQSYKAETIASKFAQSYWDLKMNPITSQYELFKLFDHFGEKEYAELAEYSKEIGMDFMSTPFDFDAADYLEKMMGVYKISSSDLSNLPFIEYIALKQKPIFISVGASNLEEIDAALQTIRRVNAQPIAVLHCVLEYPAPEIDSNLEKIRSLRERYPNLYVGFSDHTIATKDCFVQTSAALLGAQIIEKHFTLDKTLLGNDHLHSMDAEDARNIVTALKRVRTVLGDGALKCLETERVSRLNARRSLVLTRDVRAGEVLTDDLVVYKRPGTGISPARKHLVLGRRFKQDHPEDTIVTDDMIE